MTEPNLGNLSCEIDLRTAKGRGFYRMIFHPASYLTSPEQVVLAQPDSFRTCELFVAELVRVLFSARSRKSHDFRYSFLHKLSALTRRVTSAA